MVLSTMGFCYGSIVCGFIDVPDSSTNRQIPLLSGATNTRRGLALLINGYALWLPLMQSHDDRS